MATSNDVRRGRYSGLFDSIISSETTSEALDIDDFFAEPFYQLMRQQMLAHEIERDLSNALSRFERVTLAHVAPAANIALGRVRSAKMAAALGGADQACTGWSRLLAQPDRYASVPVESLFAAFPVDQHPELLDWHRYMRSRYAFLEAAA